MIRVVVILSTLLWLNVGIRRSVASNDYDKLVLHDRPVAFWADATGKDFTGHRDGVVKAGTYPSGAKGTSEVRAGGSGRSSTSMPDGSAALDFNGQDQYLEVASDPGFSVPATGVLTIEAWLRPDVLDFDKTEGSGYVYWLGKGAPGQHEYAGRMYGQHPTGHDAPRANRISGYCFNAAGGLGAGSYYQAPPGDPIRVGEWIHYVLVINTTYTKLYVTRQGHATKTDQDALAGYHIVPTAGNAPFRVGTRDFGSFFKGAVGKVAIYNYELSARQIADHERAMWK